MNITLENILSLEPKATMPKTTMPKADHIAVCVPAECFYSFMQKIKTEFSFDFLLSHTAVDWQNSFELIYYLYSVLHKSYVLVSVSIPRENPHILSVQTLWRTAEFQEREVYDLFGVIYDNHPDLRRLFLEDEWQGFPLRKDYKDDFVLTPEMEKGLNE
ncbi:MAG: NADH-quinone oxidoreductase subunit C [Deltaproteobacteria bacterium]|nr:NADH-quinone oxidoreductase subunit C [Deltaproteobacteria bacterium]